MTFDININKIPWLNPRFVIYPYAWRKVHVAHIVTPKFVADGLFPNNGETLCGISSESLAKSTSYVRRDGLPTLDPQFVDAIPPGYELCRGCWRHLVAYYLPFVEEEE